MHRVFKCKLHSSGIIGGRCIIFHTDDSTIRALRIITSAHCTGFVSLNFIHAYIFFVFIIPLTFSTFIDISVLFSPTHSFAYFLGQLTHDPRFYCLFRFTSQLLFLCVVPPMSATTSSAVCLRLPLQFEKNSDRRTNIWDFHPGAACGQWKGKAPIEVNAKLSHPVTLNIIYSYTSQITRNYFPVFIYLCYA